MHYFKLWIQADDVVALCLAFGTSKPGPGVRLIDDPRCDGYCFEAQLSDAELAWLKRLPVRYPIVIQQQPGSFIEYLNSQVS